MKTHIAMAYAEARIIGEQLRKLEERVHRDVPLSVDADPMTELIIETRRALGALVLELAELATEDRAADVATLPANVTRHPAWMGRP